MKPYRKNAKGNEYFCKALTVVEMTEHFGIDKKKKTLIIFQINLI